ncbi:MAG: hypothetical protein PHS80_01270 [Methanothrix sp.]|nr:hypothetical protein [Methanothrix sp.]MDD4447311.1 hypothetical protein [Methanothrix sp.]
MFESTSRYYPLETTVHTMQDGRIVAYKRRRFLPRGEEMDLLVEATVTEGDRLDLITGRTLGNPEFFWRICDANDAMNPFDLVAEINRKLRVPLP